MGSLSGQDWVCTAGAIGPPSHLQSLGNRTHKGGSSCSGPYPSPLCGSSLAPPGNMVGGVSATSTGSLCVLIDSGSGTVVSDAELGVEVIVAVRVVVAVTDSVIDSVCPPHAERLSASKAEAVIPEERCIPRTFLDLFFSLKRYWRQLCGLRQQATAGVCHPPLCFPCGPSLADVATPTPDKRKNHCNCAFPSGSSAGPASCTRSCEAKSATVSGSSCFVRSTTLRWRVIHGGQPSCARAR